MVTTLENKIKITFEFDTLRELSNLYDVLVTARVSISKRQQDTTDVSDYTYFSRCWSAFNDFAEKFNPANF